MEKPSAAGSQPSPYGTRSRNRTGATRPNYAEDKDLDLEMFDAYPQRKDDDAKKLATKQQGASSTPTPANSTPAAAPRAGNGSSRKPLPEDGKQHNGTKDQPQQQQQQNDQHQPSTAASSSSSSNTNGAGTANGASKGKKRKVADTAPTTSGSQTPSGLNGTVPSSSSGLQKRLGTSGQGSGNATPSSTGYGETNLVTFENSKSRPKDGKMIADDGTVLEVNGTFFALAHTPMAWVILFILFF
jgi:hypothetical protein